MGSKRTTKRWVLSIFLLNLVLRLLLLNWHPACYTDSIYYMTALEKVRGTFILPAYPFAVLVLKKIFPDPVVAGRLVSVLFGAAAVLPLYGLTRVIYGRRAALITIGLYTFSPLVFRWSLRIFPHAQFSFFLITAIYCFFKVREGGKAAWLSGGIFFSGLAALTYPNGLVLFPVCLAGAVLYLFWKVVREGKLKLWLVAGAAGGLGIGAVFYFFPGAVPRRLSDFSRQLLVMFPVNLPVPERLWLSALAIGIWLGLVLAGMYLLPGGTGRRGLWSRRPLNLILLALSFGSWVFLHVWQKYLAQSYWYQKGMESSFQSVLSRWRDWLSHYLYSYPYVLTYPVAVFAALGLVLTVIKARRDFGRWLWLVFYLYFATAIFYVLVVNKWWTPRYQYDLIPFALIFSGYALDSLLSPPRVKWLGLISLAVCLAGSLVFTAFALYWSRDSFGDIARSSAFLRENYPGGRIYTDESLKTGFWTKKPLRGYTSGSRGSLQAGDVLVLHGWHTNLNQEYAYLQNKYETEIVHRDRSVIIPLLADDVVDWAGKKLSRRANAPVVWEQRFQKQNLESWVIEIKGRRGALSRLSPSSRVEETSGGALLTDVTEKAHYFDVGVWEVLAPVAKGEKIRLEMAHAREGTEGSFWMEAYADADGDGLPDSLVAQSPLLKGSGPGQWSAWEFVSPGGKLFVGSRWDLGNWVYYANPPWPDEKLGEVMYYSRGGVPKSIAHRVTNLRLSFPERPGD